MTSPDPRIVVGADRALSVGVDAAGIFGMRLGAATNRQHGNQQRRLRGQQARSREPNAHREFLQSTERSRHQLVDGSICNVRTNAPTTCRSRETETLLFVLVLSAHGDGDALFHSRTVGRWRRRRSDSSSNFRITERFRGHVRNSALAFFNNHCEHGASQNVPPQGAMPIYQAPQCEPVLKIGTNMPT